MEKEVYEGKIFCMEINPETKVKTVQIEVELNDLDFDTIKERWCDEDTIDLRIIE